MMGRIDYYTTSGTHNGIHIGQEGQQSQPGRDYIITTRVYNNILHGVRHHGIEATCRPNAPTPENPSNNPICNLYIDNNIIDETANASSGYAGIYAEQTSNGTLNLYVRNNIITNNGDGAAGGYGMRGMGIIGGELDNNIFAGNGINSVGISLTNSDTGEPTYTDYANDDFTYASDTDNGVGDADDLSNDTYPCVACQTAIAETTNWSSDPIVVGTVDRALYTPWDMGPHEFAGSGVDVSGPTISNKDPYDGEQLTYGTTSVNGDIDATDASGVEGCECNEGSFSYGDGTTMTNPAGVTYRCGLLTGLANDTLYDDTWHYICQDSSDNSNETNGTWSFSVSPTSGGDVIVDNLDAGFSQSTTGWAGDIGRDDAYGDSHDYDTTSGAQGSDVWARWTPTISTSGTYEVYMWTFDGGHPDAAPFTIVHSSGTA
jgi:hypothetical protein